LDFKDQELRQKIAEIENCHRELESLKTSHRQELEVIESDTLAKYEELKCVYKTAQSQQNAMNNSQDHFKTNLSIEYLDRIHDLEK